MPRFKSEVGAGDDRAMHYQVADYYVLWQDVNSQPTSQVAHEHYHTEGLEQSGPLVSSAAVSWSFSKP